MNLSSALISQFVKATRDEPKKTTEATVYGTIVSYNNKLWVKLDGSDSDVLTPISTTTEIQDGERVTVMIKDHTATVTGNISSPAARIDTVTEIGSQVSEFEVILADKLDAKDITAINANVTSLVAMIGKISDLDVVTLDAINAEIDKLESAIINSDYIGAYELEVINGSIQNLEAMFAEIETADIENLEAVNAEIANLKAYTAEFTYVSAESLSAVKADIKTLNTEKLSAKDAEIKYANIDFANIGEAAIRKIFSETGMIKDLVVGEGTITGELVGVTISGDLIQGNTVKADKLVVLGSDGLYYKLNIEAGAVESAEVSKDDLQNGLHGTAIIAKTITADKVSVTDLVAFGATIGGFKITNNAIHSVAKDSATNTVRGLYMDNDGQVSFGDASNYLRYYKDSDGQYRLEIRTSGKSIDEQINDIEIGARNLIRNSTTLIFEDYDFMSKINLTVTDDGNGNIVIESSTLTVTDDGDGNVSLDSPRITVVDDGDGNITLIFEDYQVAIDLTAADDGNGNITLDSPTLAATDDGSGNVTLSSSVITAADDGDGNITLS